MEYICPNGNILTNIPEGLEYRPFEFYDNDSFIELCYELSYDLLEEMYPNYKLFASDYFGISVIDNNNDDCIEITSFSTGRLGKIGPLAMRNEKTNEVFPLIYPKTTTM